jgi:hypothetical protein
LPGYRVKGNIFVPPDDPKTAQKKKNAAKSDLP